MHKRFAKTAVMLALAALSTAALAQAQFGDSLDTEPPGRVGRVSLVQGKVSVSGDVGDTVTDALVNWPVTTRNLITTEPHARTELRIGSTAIRIDGDSSLEVTELDDDSLRLRLHYGSASIRILSEDVLPEFELTTPQGRVRMLRPGRLRVDAERVRDTSVVSVFDGEAQVDGGGASLTIRAGRSAELRDDDVRTLQARRDGFDDWSLERDRLIDGARSARYVSTEITGYEELDRYGTWQEDLEYGPLWIPSVSTAWVPYRDGRWTWISPWGWTWVDNAPWGYAPFHYGRWVQVRNRWAWAPGHKEHYGRRPVWAPALVGWVGGSGWSVNFSSHGSRLATGWYPLGPRDRYVPHYRLSDERLRRLNSWGWRDRDGDGRRDRDRDRDGRPDYRQRGLTVVPQANFGQRGSVVVPNAPRATPPAALPATPGAAPPAPQGWRERSARRDSDRDGIPDRVDRDRDGDGIPNRVDRNDAARSRADRDGDGIRDRFDRDRDGARGDGPGIPNRLDRDNRDGRFERGQRSPVLTTNPTPRPPVAAMPAPQPMPVVTQSERPERPQGAEFNRGDRGDRFERGERPDRADRSERFDRFERGQRSPVPSTNPAPTPPVAAAPAPAPVPAPVVTQPERNDRRPQGFEFNRGDRGERPDRADRTERFEGRRERPQPMAMPQASAPSAPPPQPAPPPPPRVMAAPPPPAPAPSGPPPGRGRFEQRAEDGGEGNSHNKR